MYNRARSREAERKYPPIGRFLDVDGVRLHYIERGQGQPVVLIHGNGTMIQDFTVSGLVDKLASHYRVIVFDRPGYGHSSRPRRLWTPRVYAELFHRALERLGVEQAIVLGHSWGTLIAVALALFPSLVPSLVLVSGYYYPTMRADVFLLSPPGIPLIGDAMRYTISPPLARALLPRMIRRVFEPAAVPERFHRLFPKELVVRPSQLRAAAEDSALMVPSAMELQHHYRELTLPVTIFTGADDQISDVGRHRSDCIGNCRRASTRRSRDEATWCTTWIPMRSPAPSTVPRNGSGTARERRSIAPSSRSFRSARKVVWAAPRGPREALSTRGPPGSAASSFLPNVTQVTVEGAQGQ